MLGDDPTNHTSAEMVRLVSAIVTNSTRNEQFKSLNGKVSRKSQDKSGNGGGKVSAIQNCRKKFDAFTWATEIVSLNIILFILFEIFYCNHKAHM